MVVFNFACFASEAICLDIASSNFIMESTSRLIVLVVGSKSR